MAFPVSSTAGAPGVLNVAYFLLLPDVRQRLGYLDASKLVEVLKVSEEEEEEDDDDKKEKASEEVVPTALLIFKRPLRNSLLRGLLEWNQQRAFAKQPLMSLFEIWHNFCKELRYKSLVPFLMVAVGCHGALSLVGIVEANFENPFPPSSGRPFSVVANCARSVWARQLYLLQQPSKSGLLFVFLSSPTPRIMSQRGRVSVRRSIYWR
eukprot:RCo045255